MRRRENEIESRGIALRDQCEEVRLCDVEIVKKSRHKQHKQMRFYYRSTNICGIEKEEMSPSSGTVCCMQKENA
jgi:hypothetical protein